VVQPWCHWVTAQERVLFAQATGSKRERTASPLRSRSLGEEGARAIGLRW